MFQKNGPRHVVNPAQGAQVLVVCSKRKGSGEVLQSCPTGHFALLHFPQKIHRVHVNK